VAIVSARHCELEYRDGNWFVRDLNSSNGTRVNGRPCVPMMQRLMHGDELWVAAFRFKVAYPSSLSIPPADEAPALPAAAASSGARSSAGSASSQRTPPGSRASLGDLVPCGGGRPIPMLKPSLVVGRHPQCDIVLGHGTISSRHCQLDLVKGCWQARDLGSRNGIRINGMRCEEGALPPESILSVATFRYRVVYEGPPDLAAPPQESVFDKGLLERAGLEGWSAAQDDDTETQQRQQL
jgi:adenylate cyclase